MSFAVWLTGLSGSGKSAIAAALREQLHARGIDTAVLESDVLRTQLTPFARYDEAERDFFYSTLAQLGAQLALQGKPVVFDATANRRAYRDAARRSIARFAEVFVDTPLEVCAARDTKGLYRTGRTTTLPGVQVAYEPPLAPELVVRGDTGTPAEGAALIVALLEQRGWLAPAADLYRAVVEQGPDAVIFADREGIVRLWNPRAEQLFGYAAGEAVGRNLDLIIPQHLRAAHWQGYHRAIAAGRTRSDGKPMLTRATHKDGSKLYVDVAFAIVLDERREVLGALATARKSSKPQASG
jgi:adenylylsulfate kinase